MCQLGLTPGIIFAVVLDREPLDGQAAGNGDRNSHN